MRLTLANFLLTFSLCSSFLTAEDSTVVHLTPPKLAPNTLAEKIACTRPMRNGKFNISLDPREDKTIIHCYGHGGCGWTTLFGSVQKSIDLFLSTNPSKDVPIRVLGSGCMGLTIAIELTRLGYKVNNITTKEIINIPSWQAAGYFAFVSVQTSPEEQAEMAKIGMDTFKVYQSIDKGEHPYISSDAVRYMPVYCSEETDSGVEELVAFGLVPPRERVTLDFGNGVTHPNFFKYMTYFLNTTQMMIELREQTLLLGIPVKIQEVKSFEEIPEAVIFNATGLGSLKLNHDDNMIPVRGHLIALNEESGIEHMEYMIYSKVEQDGQEEYVYLFPKVLNVLPQHFLGLPSRGVIGGTFMKNIDSFTLEEQENVDKVEFARMLDRNNVFFHGVSYKAE